MNRRSLKHPVIAFLLMFLSTSYGWCEAETNSQGIEESAKISEPITPVPPADSLSTEIVELGDRLFHDVRLSADNSISCASCHNLASNGADGLPRSIGINGARGSAKAPTIYNSCFNFVQFWDGRASDLTEQLDGPVHNPVELGSSWAEIIPKLKNDPEYSEAFSSLYEDSLSEDSVKHALVTFECSLVTTDAPFDHYLKGKEDAITDLAKTGYRLFRSYGCIACHQGVNVGGNMFQRMGAIGDYFSDRGNPTEADLGRFNHTGKEEDRYLFKVPSLRLAVKNSPYFHDGSVDRLEEAIKTMAKYQLGRTIPDKDVAAIVAFLGTLVGEHPHMKE